MIRAALLFAAIGLVLSACASPPPGSAAAVAQKSGQQCLVCLHENPGAGNTACLAICQQHEIDQATYQKSIGR